MPHSLAGGAGTGPLVVLGLLAASACSNARTSRPSEVERWAIDAAPTVTIGLDATEPEAALNTVVDATRLADGRIAVANGGLASRLPVFSGQGQYLGTIGQTGEGPGEYQWITSLQAGPRDSLFVFDAALQRLTAYGADGGLRTIQHRVPDGGAGERLRIVTRLDSDVWAVMGLESPFAGDLNQIRQDTVVSGILDGGLEGFKLLETVPGYMSMAFEVGGRRTFGGIAFYPQALQTAVGECIFVTSGQSPEVSVYTPAGRLTNVIETPNDPRNVSEEHKDEWVDHRVALTDPDGGQAFRQAVRNVPWVPELPYFKQMVADEWGRLWLQPYEPPTGLGRRWHLYTPGGERLGEVVLPTPMTVFEITEYGILGATRGEFDEEIVTLLPLGPVPVPDEVSGPCRS